uniref:Putative alcohol dehydrogenase transcription factor myb/sant-like protein n=1 Tax=Amblyomma triste TaxID=251400 RepID=A0A023G8A2_AMBTT
MNFEIDNKALICCVEARPALWRAVHRDRNNRAKTRLLWAEIAAFLLPGVPGADRFVRKRWKSLRDKYRRLVTARVLAQKDGIEAEEGMDSVAADDVSWQYFEHLVFLNDSLTRLPKSHKLSDSGVATEEVVLPETTYADVDCISLLSVESNQGTAPAASPSMESQAAISDISDQELIATVATEELPVQIPTPEDTPRKKRKGADNLQQQLREVSRLLSEYKSPDEDEYFALSLVGHMRKVKSSKKLDMQLEILKVVQKYKEQ